jgi:hypothetical protein
MKNKGIYIVSAFITLILISFLFSLAGTDSNNPFLSLSKEHKTPLGSYIFYEELSTFFSQSTWQENNKPILELKTESITESSHAYIFISEKFTPDSLEQQQLLKMASSGARIFIAAYKFSPEFLKQFDLTQNLSWGDNKKASIRFVASADSGLVYQTEYSRLIQFFSTESNFKGKIRSVLNEEKDKAVFVGIPYGKGEVMLHLYPDVFTNVQLLKKEAFRYAFVVSYFFKAENMIWDEYYKPGGLSENSSWFKHILQSRGLRSAWYLLLFLFLIAVVFQSKRKFRILNLTEPPKSNNIEFAESIGLLFFKLNEHHILARKMINQFSRQLKEQYNVIYRQSKDDAISAKTGFDLQTLSQIRIMANKCETKHRFNKNELLALHHLIEKLNKQHNPKNHG